MRTAFTVPEMLVKVVVALPWPKGVQIAELGFPPLESRLVASVAAAVGLAKLATYTEKEMSGGAGVEVLELLFFFEKTPPAYSATKTSHPVRRNRLDKRTGMTRYLNTCLPQELSRSK
jgi:hypothetical protein